MKTERGLALQDLLTGAYDYIESLELKSHARIYLVEHLATTEYVHSPIAIHFTNTTFYRHRLSTGASEKIQLTALLGAFKNAVELSAK